MVSTLPNFIMPVQNFGGRTPKNFVGEKHAKFGPISDDFKVRIPPKRIQNRIDIPSMAIPPALGETSPVKFGPVTLEILM